MTIPAPMGCVCGSWRHPDAWPPGDNLVMNLDHMISIAKKAERGKLDGIFFADGLGAHNLDYPEMFKAIIPPTSPAVFEPVTLLTAMAHHPRHTRLISTRNPPIYEPLLLPRQFAPPDHLNTSSQ